METQINRDNEPGESKNRASGTFPTRASLTSAVVIWLMHRCIRNRGKLTYNEISETRKTLAHGDQGKEELQDQGVRGAGATEGNEEDRGNGELR